MEREQIIKALELHSQGAVACLHECPYGDLRNCGSAMARDTLSLIKELNEENERLTGELAKTYKELDEQMNFYCSFTKSKVSNCPIDDEVAKAKADTVRKMQTEIKKTFSAICKGEMVDLYRIIDQIAKEMLEEGK